MTEPSERKPSGDSVCRTCGGALRASWPGFRERWPRWLAVFLAAWLLLVMWFLNESPSRSLDPPTLRLLWSGCAALAWIVALTAWVFFEAGRDARAHKLCVRQMGGERRLRMWLVPPLFALALVLGAAIVFGLAFLLVWAVYLLHQLFAAGWPLAHRLRS